MIADNFPLLGDDSGDEWWPITDCWAMVNAWWI